MKKHLSLDERFDIENNLSKGLPFKKMLVILVRIVLLFLEKLEIII